MSSKLSGLRILFLGRLQWIYKLNNNSHSITTRLRSCYCVVRMPQNRDSTNCFFSGISCVGPYPVDIHPDFGGCILLKFNFVNNSDSNGYFQLVYGGIETVIKELVISFTFTPAKWTFNVAPGSKLALMDSFVIASSLPQADECVSTVNVQLVSKASTFGQFRSHPGRRECNSVSRNFSYSLSVDLISFALLSLTIPTAIPRWN